MAENRKRITLKRTRPNPLFLEWLKELHEHAMFKKSKVKYSLKEAMNSLSKYPLPLQSGEECAILKGFDAKLCLYLNKRLEDYESSYECIKNSSPKSGLDTFLPEEPTIDINKVSLTDDIQSPTPISQTPKENLQVISENISEATRPVSCETIDLCIQQDEPQTLVVQSDVEIEVIQQESTSQPSQINKSCPENPVANSSQRVKKKRKLKYKPIYRSAIYSILMALLEHVNVNNKQTINKKDLLQLAHKYSEDSMKRPTDDTRHYLWSNIGKIVSRGLVKRIGGEESMYKLTDLGYATALELYEDTKLKQQNFDEMKSKKSEGNNEPEGINILNDSKVVINTVITTVEEDIEMEAGSYDIILLIDINESIGLAKMNDPIMVQIKKYPKLKHEYRCLSVGDFTWMARHKTTRKELILPYIIERKRMDDLAASIKDGRFHEQKFRLKKCGVNVIYMVENYDNNKNVGLPMTTLMQGIVNTRVQDGFKVHITESLVGSVQFLAILTMRLLTEYKDSNLKGHNKNAEGDKLMTFDFFMKYFIKNKPLSIKYTFIKLLLQLRGLSVERALAITNKYKTPKLLIKAYENCDQKEGETLLAHLRCENNRTVGPTISKTVYQLFTRRELS